MNDMRIHSAIKITAPALLLLAALASVSCEGSDPVAIEGSVITLTVQPNPVAPGAVSTIQARVTTEGGVPQENTEVFFSVTNGSGTIGPPDSDTTDGNGRASVTFSSATATVVTIEARSGTITKTVQITVITGTPTSHTLTTSDALINTCAEQILLQGTLLGQGGTPIAGAQVTFETLTSSVPSSLANSSNQHYDPVSTVTDGFGKYSVAFRLTNTDCTTCGSSTSCTINVQSEAVNFPSNPLSISEGL